MKILIILIFLLSILISCTNYNNLTYNNNPMYENNLPTYEICNENSTCEIVIINNTVTPSVETLDICNAEGVCEKVPKNRLLLKEGTDKKHCSNAPYLSTDYVDNWWNSEGLIDECEMPPESNMQFIFKQHNQEIYSYNGTIQVTISAINYNNNYLALQVFSAEDNNNDDLPDSWVHCGNLDTINGKVKKIILCNGENLKFIKLVNVEWNPTSLFIDRVEVLRYE